MSESRAEKDKQDEEARCKIRCDQDLSIEVRRPASTCHTCESGFNHVCCNLHWWMLSCILNAFMCPLVMMYHTLALYILPCLVVYIEGGLCCCCTWMCPACCWIHTDTDFPPTHVSIGKVEKAEFMQPGQAPKPPGCFDANDPRETGAGVEWVRIKDIESMQTAMKAEGIDHPVLLDGGIEPGDIKQGQLGNCWLLAAFAVLADHKGVLNTCMISQQYNPRGRYIFRLSSGLGDGEFIEISVDDYIPTKDGRPVFANFTGAEMWVLLLEKAFAKHPMYGSYGAIEGGLPGAAMKLITGADTYSFTSNAGTTTYTSHEVQPMSSGKGFGMYALDQETSDVKMEYPENEMFDLLNDWVNERGYCVAAGTSGKDETTVAGKIANDNGLVPGHAYSVLNLEEIDGIRLINLRNPWGTFTAASSIKWSTGHAAWTEHPKLAEACLQMSKGDKLPYSQSNGAFWMAWEDFLKFFDLVDASLTHQTMAAQELQYNEKQGLCGPLKGCCWGCTKFFVCCYGCRTLYCNKICPMDDRRAGNSDVEIEV